MPHIVSGSVSLLLCWPVSFALAICGDRSSSEAQERVFARHNQDVHRFHCDSGNSSHRCGRRHIIGCVREFAWDYRRVYTGRETLEGHGPVTSAPRMRGVSSGLAYCGRGGRSAVTHRTQYAERLTVPGTYPARGRTGDSVAARSPPSSKSSRQPKPVAAKRGTPWKCSTPSANQLSGRSPPTSAIEAAREIAYNVCWRCYQWQYWN